MATNNKFISDYAVSPGEVLEEEMESRNLSSSALAEFTGLTAETVDEIIEGRTSITADIALRLEIVFNLPAHFWSNLEQHYQETKMRLGVSQIDLLSNKPKVNPMLKNCCIFARKTLLLASLILTCLLLGVPQNVDAQSTAEDSELTQLKALATRLNNNMTNLEMSTTTLQQQIGYLQAADQSLQDEMNNLKTLNQTLQDLKEKVDRWQNYAANLEADNQSLKNQVSNLQSQVSSLQQQAIDMNRLQDYLTSLSAQMNSLQNQMNSLWNSVNNSRR